MWDKDRIHALLDAKPAAVWRAVLAIHALQTEDEKAIKATTDANGVGFGAFDAEFLSDIAVKVKRGWTMSPRQLAVVRNKMKRYHRQLAAIANERERGRSVATAGEVTVEPAEIADEREIAAERADAFLAKAFAENDDLPNLVYAPSEAARSIAPGAFS